MPVLSMTNILLGVSILVSLLAFNNNELLDRLKHYPYTENKLKEYYRLLTSGFVHGGMMHLLINMFVLWQFGATVESDLVNLFGSPIGKIYFLGMYLLTIILANIPSYLRDKENPYFASLGASGAIAGILFIYAFLHPWYKLYLYGILPIYAILGAGAYLIYSSWASKNKKDNIDHSAHFYGAVFGLLLLVLLKPSLISVFFEKLIAGFPF